ncbi:hypothetical protein D3C72_2340110 [compost metagenome]
MHIAAAVDAGVEQQAAVFRVGLAGGDHFFIQGPHLRLIRIDADIMFIGKKLAALFLAFKARGARLPAALALAAATGQ